MKRRCEMSVFWALSLLMSGWAAEARADGARRPMVLMVMFDGMRADAIEAARMPNLANLRAGAWQVGYRAAWTVTGQTVPDAAPNSAPNHVSLATGVVASKHGVSSNGSTAEGNYARYPTWLKRVVDEKPGAKALFVYSWDEDATLGPAEGVTFLGQSDAQNAVTLAETLASEGAPDATLYFINLPDDGGHDAGFYPHSDEYLAALAEADTCLGRCLAAIGQRPTFAEEDWLILVTADHGGYGKTHGQESGRQAHTVPIVISGRNVAEGRLPGLPYTYALTASALSHFGIDPVAAGLDAEPIGGTAVTDPARSLNDGLAVYMPFDTDVSNQAGITPEAIMSNEGVSLAINGFVGQYLKLEGGSIKLDGSQDLTYEGGGKCFAAIVWARLPREQPGDSLIFGNNNWDVGSNPGVALVAYRAESAKTPGVCFNYRDSTAQASRTVLGTFDREDNQWDFYAVTRNEEGVMTLYQGRCDGTLNWVAGDASDLYLKTDFPFHLGQDGTGKYGVRFVGDLDDFAFWTRGLSHDDIRRIYEYGRAGMALGDLLTIDAQDAPTLTATGYNGETLTLQFGGRRTRGYQLAVASGVEDGAGEKYAWDDFTILGEIAADTATYLYTVPQALKDADAKFRFFLLQTDDLPYAQEVESVQSDGTAFIDTGVAPRRDLVATFDVRLNVQNGQWDWLFGSYAGTDKRANFGVARFFENECWHLEVSGGNDTPFVCTLGETHHVSFSPTLFVVDGVEHPTGLNRLYFIEHGFPIELFRNRKNGVQYDQTMVGSFASFSLATPRHTVRDFSPVMDEDGVAGMFDAVTGAFFPSGGDMLIAGRERPAGRFGWVRAQSETFRAAVDVPVLACWTGAGAAGNLADPANWACTNAAGQALVEAIPMSETVIRVSGATAFAVPAGTMPACKSILFDEVVLTDDVDWRGLDHAKIDSASFIDLDGHSLMLAGADGVSVTAFTVTDTSQDTANPGEVHLDVAADATFSNTRILLTGNLRLVKEGEGIYTASYSEHTYGGGTYVKAGTARPATTVIRHFGREGSLIRVAAGATLDAWSRNMHQYAVQLDGGTYANTTNTGAGDSIINVSDLTLTADSTILFEDTQRDNDFIISPDSVWDLGGKTLEVIFAGRDPDFWAREGTVIRNGTLVTKLADPSVNGWFHDQGIIGKDGLKLDLSTILRLNGRDGCVSSVVDFVARTEDPVVICDTGRVLEIYGTFTPISPYGFNMKMMDGSTIDLREQRGTWSTTFVNQSNSFPLTFAKAATVSILVDGREDLPEVAASAEPYLMRWEEQPEQVAFELEESLVKRGFFVEPDAYGLRLAYAGGTVVILH
ncbi:MAG: alkaline phosphatase family protein [Kiritimatiellae bacterium]|nr:alkaline phosphatase family protein [Kiritimatiellia bacterium]